MHARVYENLRDIGPTSPSNVDDNIWWTRSIVEDKEENRVIGIGRGTNGQWKTWKIDPLQENIGVRPAILLPLKAFLEWEEK